MPGWVSGPTRKLLSPGGVFLRLTGVRIDVFCKWSRLKRKKIESNVLQYFIYIYEIHVFSGICKAKMKTSLLHISNGRSNIHQVYIETC